MTKAFLPKPVVVAAVCSLCDQPWAAHGANPTPQDCIRLLKAKLAATPTIIQQPVVVLPRPYVYPAVQPYWSTTTPAISGVGHSANAASVFSITSGALIDATGDDDDGLAPVGAVA